MDLLNEYSYDEMLEKASEVSPNAKPVFVDGRWYIVVATGVEPKVLDRRFEGTPAWKHSDNGTTAENLREWAGTRYRAAHYEPSNLEFMPLEAIAEYYNLNTKLMVEGWSKFEALRAEAGCTRETPKRLDSETLKKLKRRAKIETLSEAEDEIAKLTARWNGAMKF